MYNLHLNFKGLIMHTFASNLDNKLIILYYGLYDSVVDFVLNWVNSYTGEVHVPRNHIVLNKLFVWVN